MTDAELEAPPLTGHDWHPEWNYDLGPALPGMSSSLAVPL